MQILKHLFKPKTVKYYMVATLSLIPFAVDAKTILIVGDSISAGYGINPEQGWVQLLQKRLAQQYPKQHKVVNASVSGETTSGALLECQNYYKAINLMWSSSSWVVMMHYAVTASNDPKNLGQLVQQSQQAKAKVLLFGMKIPPNYGTAYSQAFENNYKVISQQYKIKLLPFFMQGIAGHKDLMQNDQIHPNAKAQSILLNNAYPYIKGAL